MTSQSQRVVLVVFLCVVVGAVTVLVTQNSEPQTEITDAVGRAHAAAHRERHTKSPLAAGQTIHEYIGTPAELPGSPPPLSDEDLHGRLCGAESLAAIRVTGRRGFLTDDASFIYTVYGARVLRIIKPSDGVPPTLQTVTFSRPGGTVPSERGATQVQLDAFPSFDIGQEDVVALRQVNGVLVADNPFATFQIDQGIARTVGEREPPHSPSLPLADVEARLAIAMGSPCPGSEVQR